MTLLLTGATGFIGRSLLSRLSHSGIKVRALARNVPEERSVGVDWQKIAGIEKDINWAEILVDCDTVIHSAARVHVMRETAIDSLAEYRHINVRATECLAQQAAAAGVRRFVFLSSVKVNGEETFGKPFTAHDQPHPIDAYGISKWEAEQALNQIWAATGMEIVILRLPLVYGPGVGGNFSAMLRLLQKGWPLPLGAVLENRRSLVALDNVIDLVITCIDHPRAANRTFMVSDGEDVSTRDILRRTARAMGMKVHLFPIPAGLLRFSAAMFGKTATIRRLLGSLQVDIAETTELLGWTPSISLDEGLRRAVEPLL